jgi:hypothetical protein
MGTRDGGECETTTQSTQDNDAITRHHKPRARRKSWDAGPPPADTDAPDTSRATGQPTADIDAAQTHFTHTPHPHVTHTYTQDARKAAEGPVHPLTPIPHQTQIIPPSPIPHTRAAESAAPAVSEPLTLAGNTLKHIDAQRVCTHTSTPEADFSSANASVGKGPQEKLVRDSEIRTGVGADGGGGTELIASQDEPHEEEPVFDQAPAEEEEDPASEEWTAEGEHEEDEEAPATEASGSEGGNESASADGDEERPVSQASEDDAASAIEEDDGEEDNERSERLFGYDPDGNGNVWDEYQAVMGDPMFAW